MSYDAGGNADDTPCQAPATWSLDVEGRRQHTQDGFDPMTHAAQGLTDLVRRSAAEAGVTLE